MHEPMPDSEQPAPVEPAAQDAPSPVSEAPHPVPDQTGDAIAGESDDITATPDDPAVRPLVMKSARDWADTLIDRTGRNELLICRDRGKLGLDAAKPEALGRLLRGQAVRLKQLFSGDALVAATKTAEQIRKRIKEYDEERGVRVGRLVYGFATWRDPKEDRVPRAPLLLREVSITRRPGMDELELVADKDVEINPVFLHYLRSTFRVEVDPGLIAELNDDVDEPEQVPLAIERLRIALEAVPDLRFATGVLVGTFHYAKLAMHQDLLDNARVFAGNDLFAAMAGDLEAIDRVRRPAGDVSLDQPDVTAPADEFLVLDADPSQNYVINAALAGRNLVVQGPPGTGKSQTISNLIASLAARGKTVLFVAEKRAAIEAVLGRLNQAGLGDLTLDLHVTTANKARVYEQFRTAIANSRSVPPLDAARQDARLDRLRRILVRHDSALHRPRQPWGISAFQAQIAVTETPVDARTPIRLGGTALAGLHGEAADEARDRLIELWVLGGLAPAESLGPWGGAHITDDADATRSHDMVIGLRAAVPDVRRAVAELAARTRLPEPPTIAEAEVLANWCDRTVAAAAHWRPEIYRQDLDELLAATGDKADRTAYRPGLGWFARRRVLKRVKALRTAGGSAAQWHAELLELAAVRAEWQNLTGDVPPPAIDTGALRSGLERARTPAGELATILPEDVATTEWDTLQERLGALAMDPNAPHRVARINRLTAQIDEAGLGDLVAWIGTQLPEWPDEKRSGLIGDSFDHAWFASVLDLVMSTDDHLAAFDGAAHSTAVAEFAATDRAHLVATRHRVRRLVAERLTQVRGQHHDQDLFLDRELDKKRRLRTLRDLMRQAPDVLLAAKPCWALSPLLVSQLLPPTQLFDVVIFDEASQVQPAEAMAAMARARSAVIAGDSKQLPPTAFFESALEANDELPTDDATDGGEALTVDVESVLEAFNRALGASIAGEYYLGWHYRSQDARLIAPSNAYFYENRMTTFPGTSTDAPVTFVEVEGAESAQGTSPAEVRRVVELVLEHARTRPDDSLGVITMGLAHSEAIDRALQLRLRDEPELRDWFGETGDEPFFIKNLERVQGDERDAIVLAIGYGKSGGRMMHRFGPLNMAGGERRLNVAITRAKKRMTVVAGFHPDDLDPEKLRSEGAQRLADYLRYAARGAQSATGAVRGAPVLNPFEIQVRNRLLAAGVPVQPQWGERGQSIDFVATHPDDPERMVLAIETDGATYHSAATTRARDRLRQEHLERLGWRFHRIWSTEWFRHPDREVARVQTVYREAVAQSDGTTIDPADLQLATGTTPSAESRTPETPADDPAVRSDPMGDAVVESTERGPQPDVPLGLPITDYTDDQLIAVVAWVRSDGGLRTDEELAKETRDALGIGRGSRIDARIATAIDDVRKSDDSMPETGESQPAGS